MLLLTTVFIDSMIKSQATVYFIKYQSTWFIWQFPFILFCFFSRFHGGIFQGCFSSTRPPAKLSTKNLVVNYLIVEIYGRHIIFFFIHKQVSS